jgi:hypothetical protein
MMTERASVNP